MRIAPLNARCPCQCCQAGGRPLADLGRAIRNTMLIVRESPLPDPPRRRAGWVRRLLAKMTRKP